MLEELDELCGDADSATAGRTGSSSSQWSLQEWPSVGGRWRCVALLTEP